MEKDIEEILKKYSQEIKRHIGVLKEDFDSKVQLIAQQYDSIIKRLDGHDRKFTSIERKLDSQGEKLDSQEVRIASIEEKLTSIEKNIEMTKVDINFIKNGLKRKVDAEEFETLERRVAILEARMGKTAV